MTIGQAKARREAASSAPRVRLARITLGGFKSIRAAELELGPLNVLIGPNGGGKSNLIAFFRMLRRMTASPGELQLYVGMAGGASALLFDGPEVTWQLQATLSFESGAGASDYDLRLAYAGGDDVIFAVERYRFSGRGSVTPAEWISLGAGHREARLIERAEDGEATARSMLDMLKGCAVYHFHNTSETARIRQRWDVEDGAFLKEDAGNLAPFLYRMQQGKPRYYQRIVSTVRLLAPFFADFHLEPSNGRLLLQWTERGTDQVFGAHQASDGTLRVMALVALLLQPEKDLPPLIILDEPELGLHPYAVDVLAGMLRSVTLRTQVIVATQSAALVNYFDPEEIVVVERRDRGSTYERQTSGRLAEWLEEYTMAELWEKNVLGGTP